MMVLVIYFIRHVQEALGLQATAPYTSKMLTVSSSYLEDKLECRMIAKSSRFY